MERSGVRAMEREMPPATVISLRLPPDLAVAIDAHCRSVGVSRTDYLSGLAAQALGVPYTLGTERTGWAGASEATIRRAVDARTKRKNKATK